MVTIDISYKGDLHCKAIHGPSETIIETDAPVDNHGKGESFSPSDLLATALGVCNMTIMGIIAMDEGINLKGSKVKVEKHMSTDSPRRIVQLNLSFDMATGIPKNKRILLETATGDSPVMKSIHPDIKVNLTFNYKD